MQAMVCFTTDLTRLEKARRAFNLYRKKPVNREDFLNVLIVEFLETYGNGR